MASTSVLRRWTTLFLFLVALIFVIGMVYYATYDPNASSPIADFSEFNFNNFPSSENLFPSVSDTTEESKSCTDTVWCHIDPPKKSFFRFPTPPDDLDRWRKAQYLASTQDHILLQSVIKQFPNNMNFLDGDILFRQYHRVTDFFLDDNYDFDIVNSKVPLDKILSIVDHKQKKFGWENDPQEKDVIPPVYDSIRSMSRAPILHFGYFAFSRKGRTQHFGGANIGEAIVDKGKMLRMWKKKEAQIDIPWIGLHSANENWGVLSTLFPNRTIDWGKCCNDGQSAMIVELLNHEKTLMLLVNQHYNLTHPKLLSLPRGVPLHNTHANRLLHDSMLKLLRTSPLPPPPPAATTVAAPSTASASTAKDQQAVLRLDKKSQLLFTASSNWGYRPKISECIAKKFVHEPAVKFRGYGAGLKGRFTPAQYYEQLGTSLFSVALPGLGYDTHRLWEAMTLGTIPIVEKGVGLDKTLWRLPALIVEDFDEVTPDLLRQVYVEALYRVKEFELQRLTQSYWWDFIMNVSSSRSSESILSFFPLESEDPTFARPFVPYECSHTNTCGVGTKRTPKSYC